MEAAPAKRRERTSGSDILNACDGQAPTFGARLNAICTQKPNSPKKEPRTVINENLASFPVPSCSTPSQVEKGDDTTTRKYLFRPLFIYIQPHFSRSITTAGRRVQDKSTDYAALYSTIDSLLSPGWSGSSGLTFLLILFGRSGSERGGTVLLRIDKTRYAIR